MGFTWDRSRLQECRGLKTGGVKGGVPTSQQETGRLQLTFHQNIKASLKFHLSSWVLYAALSKRLEIEPILSMLTRAHEI